MKHGEYINEFEIDFQLKQFVIKNNGSISYNNTDIIFELNRDIIESVLHYKHLVIRKNKDLSEIQLTSSIKLKYNRKYSILYINYFAHIQKSRLDINNRY